MTRLKNPRAMLITAMTVFGTIGLFVRNIAVASAELALYRAVLAALLLGLYFVVTKESIDFKRIGKELPLLLLSGAAMGFNWILLFEAYKYTTVSVATLSYYFAPVIVTVACPILFREKMGIKQWICFLMSTLGIVLITGIGDLSGNNQHHVGIAFGLGAAVLYATVILLNKHIRGVAGIQRTFLQFVAAIAVLLPYVLCTCGISLGNLNGIGWLNLLVVGLFHTGVTYCLYFSALKELPGQEAVLFGEAEGETVFPAEAVGVQEEEPPVGAVEGPGVTVGVVRQAAQIQKPEVLRLQLPGDIPALCLLHFLLVRGQEAVLKERGGIAAGRPGPRCPFRGQRPVDAHAVAFFLRQLRGLGGKGGGSQDPGGGDLLTVEKLPDGRIGAFAHAEIVGIDDKVTFHSLSTSGNLTNREMTTAMTIQIRGNRHIINLPAPPGFVPGSLPST